MLTLGRKAKANATARQECDRAISFGDEEVGLVANLYYQQDRGGPTYILKQVLIRSHVESHVENHVNR